MVKAKIKQTKNIQKENSKRNQKEENSDIEEETKNVVKAKNSRRTKKVEQLNEMITKKDSHTGVLYVAHLPWGTNDDLLKKYFQQFGVMRKHILPRSKTTGRIKGYAFIEYDSEKIARLAAQTMNNFILFDRIIKCNVVEDKTRYPLIFRKWKRKFKFANKYEKFVHEKNRKKTPKELKLLVENYLVKEEKKREKLKEMGIQYSFPGYKSLLQNNKSK